MPNAPWHLGIGKIFGLQLFFNPLMWINPVSLRQKDHCLAYLFPYTNGKHKKKRAKAHICTSGTSEYKQALKASQRHLFFKQNKHAEIKNF